MKKNRGESKPGTTGKFLSYLMVLPTALAFLFSTQGKAQGTWTKVAAAAPHFNMGVMLQLTDGTVICHNSLGGTYGTGWDKLTPNANGSYANGTWTSTANMISDRLFFATQVLPNGKVFACGGEYGAGSHLGEVYDPVANTWTATGAVPANPNLYDCNSEILPNGTVLVGDQIGANPSFNNVIYNNGSNTWIAGPNSPLNHDEAEWLKLPDSSILFVGIGTTQSCRYEPKTNTWIADAGLPVQLYDPFGSEAGAAFMLPNGKAIFLGATGHNAIYTPSGTVAPGTWAAAADFPKVGGIQTGTPDATAAMMANGKILCAASFVGSSPSDEFRAPTYFFEYDYITNSFTQVISNFPGLGADSLAGVACFQTSMLDLPDGTVLMGINQSGLSKTYFIYNPVGLPLASGKPTIRGIDQSICPTYKIFGTGFNGICEGAAYGDDWQMSTNYPIIRLTNGANVYYCKTTNWNRIGAVMTDSAADTCTFTLPAGLPNATYQLVVIANGNPSNPTTLTTPCSCGSPPIVTVPTIVNVLCNGGATGSATCSVSSGAPPYTYAWTPSGGTNSTASALTAGVYTITVTDKNGCSGSATATITQPTALTITTGSIVNVDCFGNSNGSAVGTASGGTSPYTYTWTPSGGTSSTATGLTAGTYTITLKDKNACTATASAVITQPATALTVTTSGIVNVLCNGNNTGSATANASGGTSPYTYAWTPSGGTASTATGLTAGTYTITLKDAHGCTSTASAVITQPATALTVTTSAIVNVLCNGNNTGSATANASGGTPAYTYAWTPSGGTASIATGLTAGTYTITLKDSHGCTSTASAVITQPAAALTVITSTTPATCGSSNGTATANASGGTGAYTYAWTPSGGSGSNATGLTAGTYTITLKDANGCTVTASAIVTNSGGETVSINTVTNVNCFGNSTGSITTNTIGGTLPYTYAWTPVGGTNSSATGLSAATYTITVKDANGCVSTASAVVTQPAAALTVTTGPIVNVLCNGNNTGSATANASGGTVAYTYAWTPSGGTSSIATGLTAGTYTITVTDAHACTSTASAVITQPATALTVTTSTTPATCGSSNGTATANASGGTGAYTYSWAPSGGTSSNATGLTAGTYTITLKDANGCTITASAIVTNSGGESVSINTITNVNCFGNSTGSITTNTVGGTLPYTYAWTPVGGTNSSATGLSAATYTITVKDANGCVSTASATVTQPAAALTVTTGSIVNVLCRGNSTGSATATAGGGTPAYTYAWTPSGGTSSTASGLSAGTYTITLTDSHGCTATASAVITQPFAALTVTTSTTPAACGGNNGTATGTASGGTGAYTYSWAPSGGTGSNATGLTAGTYTITLTDANGCTATGSAVVNGVAGETVSINTITNVNCFGNSTGSITTNTVGGTLPYTYAWTPVGGTNSSATGLSAATYTITVKDANGCVSTASATITQPATALTVTTGSIVNVLCKGSSTGSATANAAGGTVPYTYAWTPSGGTNSTATGLTAGTYTITVTDKNGCTSTAQAVITQPATALTVTTVTTSATCGGSNGTATANASGGTGAYTYSWAPSGGTNALATGLAAATYTVTVTDANGCTATASAVVTNGAGETVTINTITNVSCFGGSNGSITTNTVGGTLPYTYAWSPVGGTNSSATGLSAATYTITVKDATGCVSTASATVTQPPLLTVTTSGIVNENCFGNSTGSATANAAGGTVPYTYAWTPSGGTSSTATGLTAGTYTITVTDKNGCTATASAVITQPATALTVTTSGIVNVKCNGGNTGSATANAGGGTPAYTYAWTPSGGTASTATGLTAGTYTITLKDSHGCTSTASAVITQPPLLTVTITGTVNVKCNGGSTGSLTSTPGGGTSPYTFAWTPSGGTNATATGLSAGTYTITLKDANGCTATASGTITQPTALTASITASSNVTCNGGSNGSATAAGSGGTPAYTYAWTPSGGTSATASNLTAGTYTITITDANGCNATASVTLTQPPPLVVVPVNPVICSGSSIVLTASGAATYMWTPATGLSCNNCPNPTATPTVTTSYTVTGTTGGCVSSVSVVVTVKPTPVITVIPPSANLCSGDSLTLVANGATSYTWAPAGSLSAPVGVVVTAFPAVTTTYTVTGTTNGCSSTDMVTVTVTPTPTVTVTAPSSICSGGNVILTAAGATTYTWTPATGLSATVGTSVTASPTVTTSYTVTGTSGLCSAAATTVVTVTPTPTVVVTPSSATICSGGPGTTLTASGATTYSWAPAAGLSAVVGSTVTANPVSTTTYTVTGTNGACISTTTVVITVNPTPTVTVNPPSSSICSGGNVNLTASGAATYTWAPATGLSATVGANVTATPTVTTSYTVTGTNGTCSDTAVVVITVTPTPIVTVNPPSDSICSGGGVVLTASGASTYNWAPAAGLSSTSGPSVTASPTVTTTYTVTGSNGLCSSIDSVTITVTPTPTVTIAPPASSICTGGNVLLTASGATTYTWTPATGLSSTVGASVTASPLVTTTYTVTGTTGSCSASQVVTVVVNPTPVVHVNPTSATICTGGPGVTLTASGAFTYNWAPAAGLSAIVGINVVATPTITTTYTVTGVSKFGCSATASVTITVDSGVVTSLTATKDTICRGDSTTLTATGGGTYSWSNGATTSSITVSPAGNTTYSVTVSKLACSANASITIVVNAPTVPVITQSGDTLKCTPAGLPSYQWYLNGSPMAGSTSDTVIISQIGNYKVMVTNSSGCSDTALISVDNLVGVNEISFGEFINVYPNPTSGNLHIDCAIPEGNYSMALTDVLGQVLYTSNVHISGTYSGNINMYSYSPGLYILTIKGNNSITEKKVLLSK